VEPGELEVLIGASSRDIRLAGAVEVTSSASRGRSAAAAQTSALSCTCHELSYHPASFEALYGRTLPSNDLAKRAEHTLNTPIGDMTATIVGRVLYKVIQRKINR
jgi:hypothetical protein